MVAPKPSLDPEASETHQPWIAYRGNGPTMPPDSAPDSIAIGIDGIVPPILVSIFYGSD